MVLLAVVILPIVVSSARAESIEIVFDREADRLGLQVSEAPLPLLMRRLTEVTGIGFQLGASLNEERLSLNRTPVGTEEALRQLLRQYNHILYYGRDAQGRLRIQSVVVLAREGKTSTSLTPTEFPATSGMVRPMDVANDKPAFGAATSASAYFPPAGSSTANTILEGAAVSVPSRYPPPDPFASNTPFEDFSSVGNNAGLVQPPKKKPPIQNLPSSQNLPTSVTGNMNSND